MSGWWSSGPRSCPSTSRASKTGDPIEEVLPGWFVLAGVWGLGAWLRQHRGAMRELAEEADALVRDRDEATRAAVVYERARIARELHDLVAHTMAIIVLQAQAGGRVLEGDVEAARRAFTDIESTGREGMTELRRLLDILLVQVPPEEVDPRPGLEQVERLAQRVRDAGLPVELSVSGDPRPLPAGVDISAYRIVQEALTNTLKHAGRASASVGVSYRPGEVELSICDDGAAGPREPWRDAPGHGLIGMRSAPNCSVVRWTPGLAGRRVPGTSGASDRYAVIHILLADDEELVRTGLRMILRSEPDLEIVGEAINGEDALRKVSELAPDVVLLDLRMPDVDGLAVLHRLPAGAPPVVVLTTFDTDANVQEALLAGAAGFLLKDAPAAQLVAAVRAAASGDAVLSRSVARRVFSACPTNKPSRDPPPRGPHRARTAGPHPDRGWVLQRRDRPTAAHRRGHGEDPRGKDPDEAGRPRPIAGGGRCLSRRAGDSRTAEPPERMRGARLRDARPLVLLARRRPYQGL